MLYLGIIGYNNFGSKMEIVNEYKKYNEKLKRNYTYVDVYFHDYDWTFYGATYNNFKKGKIACEGTAHEVMTKENLRELFNIDAEIVEDPRSKKPVCITYDMVG